MSGHSKWAGIKHKKAIIDSKRGKVFTKIIREITISAKQGGGNPDNNPRLRKAIDDARASNMPQDNIKKALQRGTGELPGVVYEEVVYEGYGPGGVAVVVSATTDNKNRTVSEIRKIFSQSGGNLGDTGCVSWMFSQKGYISVKKEKINEDEITTIALDAGASDLKTDDEEIFEIITEPPDFEKIKNALSKEKIPIDSSEITMLPSTYIRLESKQAEQMLNLMNALEDHDDVTEVYANFDIPEEMVGT